MDFKEESADYDKNIRRESNSYLPPNFSVISEKIKQEDQQSGKREKESSSQKSK